MSQPGTGRPGAVSIAEALERAKANQFKAGVRNVTTAERIYNTKNAAVSTTSSVAGSGGADTKLRWIVLAAVAAGCLILALIAAFLTGVFSSVEPETDTKGGVLVEDLPGILYMHTESGRVVNAGPDDFASSGSMYQVHYHENGRFTFSANGYAQHGYFLMTKNLICRAKKEEEVESHCAAIFDMGDGTYQARDQNGGELRYTFRIGG